MTAADLACEMIQPGRHLIRTLSTTERASTGTVHVHMAIPRCSAWQASPPGNYFEVQDFNTEMWINASFAAEVAGLRAASGIDHKLVF